MTYREGELIGGFDTEEQAKECAGLYGIELRSFNNGVAVFKAGGNIEELIALGRVNGWPALEPNYIMKAF